MRSLKGSLFVLALLTKSAFAISVEPEGPYTFDTSSRMFIATTAVPIAAIDTGDNFKQFDVTTAVKSAPTGTTSGGLILFHVTDIPADKEDVQIVAKNSSGHMVAPVYPNNSPPGSAYAPPFADYYYSVKTNGATDLFLYINLYTICFAGGAGVNGCTGAAVTTSSAGDWGFQLTAIARDDTEDMTTAPSTVSGAAFSVYPQAVQSTTACSGAAPYFFPADGSITVDPGRFTFTANTLGASTVKRKLIVMANLTPGVFGYGAGTTWTAHTIVGRGSPTSEQSYDGFTNYTPTNIATYSGGYAFQDTAGVMSSSACGPDTMVAGEIASFLKESNCFIAGASFQDENAKPVLMLRLFRDQVLAKTKLGRQFIGLYYTDGPLAAEWLKEHPHFRLVALALLVPVQILAWIALNPSILWIPFSILMFLGLGLLARRSKMAVSVLALFLLSNSLNAAEPSKTSHSPYIDSLLSGIEEEEGPQVERTAENPDPYIQARKKRLAKKESATDYTDTLKKDLDAEDDPTGYTAEEKRRLGPGEPKSAIADFRSGKKLKERRGDTRAKGSFGFRLMTSSNRVYNAGSAEEVAYNTAYGSKWTPDVLFSYERRPFKAWAANRLGVMGAFGFSWAQADAQFKYTLPGFTSTSQTKIKFITFPLLVGLTYKMNLFDFLYPYVGAGPGMFFFYETRSDGLGNSRGYSFGSWMIAGMNFGLDWLSQKSSWDRFASSGVKHSYFSIEYSRQSTFSGGLVDMTVDGISVGFNFEI